MTTSPPTEPRRTTQVPAVPRDIDHGRYRLLEPIGRGGYGSVFRAVQTSIDRVVALKLVHPHLETREDVAERFRREARLTSRLRHPNAVRVIDFGVDGGSLFLVMEYVDGCTLKELVARETRLSHDRIRHIVRGIAGALGAAHEIGLVHRDLKPSNVLITPDDDPVVIDFGLVKVFSGEDDGSSVTRSDVMIGTPSYLSPEAVVGQPLDGRADLYALGILLYELLTGHRPFAGATALEVATARLHEEPEALPPSVPRDLRVTCERLLERHPADRPSSASWVLDSLDTRPAPEPRPPTPATVSVGMDATTAPARGPAAHPQLRSIPQDAPQRGVAAPTSAASASTHLLAPTEKPAKRSHGRRTGLAVAGALVMVGALGVFAFVRADASSRIETSVSDVPTVSIPEPPQPRLPSPAEASAALPNAPSRDEEVPTRTMPAEDAVSAVSVSDAGLGAERTVAGGSSSPPSSGTPAGENRPAQQAQDGAAGDTRPNSGPDDEPADLPETSSQVEAVSADLAVRERERPPDRVAPSARQEVQHGYLTINIEPWGTVSIDGEEHGEAPLRRVALPEGVHEVRSTYRGQVQTERVRVRHGESITLTHRFAR